MKQVLDDNYLGITALVTIGMQLTFFAIAAALKFDKVTDLAGSANFVLLAFLTYGLGASHDRQLVNTLLVAVWGVRLGGFLLYRVLKRGKDERFDEIRENFFKFLGFWIFQMIWVWCVSLPITFLNAAQTDAKIGERDIIGWVFWGIGFFFEAVADQSKNSFSENPNNKGRFLSDGVWHYSRHPNYFGEIMMWLGLFLSSSSVFEQPGNTKAAYVSVLSPVLTFVLLMFLSGAPLAEERYDKKFGRDPAYLEYKKNTSPLIPMPPALYGALSNSLKCLFFCEFPIYSRALKPERQTLLDES